MRAKREESRTQDVRADLDERALSAIRADERLKEISIDDRMNATDILYFPIHKVPYKWTYKWIRRSVLGVPDLNHERNQMRMGWSPVPASRHPEEARTHLYGGDEVVGDVIERKGLILCEMPTEAANKYNNQRDKAHMDVMKSLGNAIEQMPADPTVPRAILENSDDFTPNLGRTFGFT